MRWGGNGFEICFTKDFLVWENGVQPTMSVSKIISSAQRISLLCTTHFPPFLICLNCSMSGKNKFGIQPDKKLSKIKDLFIK